MTSGLHRAIRGIDLSALAHAGGDADLVTVHARAADQLDEAAGGAGWRSLPKAS